MASLALLASQDAAEGVLRLLEDPSTLAAQPVLHIGGVPLEQGADPVSSAPVDAELRQHGCQRLVVAAQHGGHGTPLLLEKAAHLVRSFLADADLLGHLPR